VVAKFVFYSLTIVQNFKKNLHALQRYPQRSQGCFLY